MLFLVGFVYVHSSHILQWRLWDSVYGLPHAPLLLVGDFKVILGAHKLNNRHYLSKLRVMTFES